MLDANQKRRDDDSEQQEIDNNHADGGDLPPLQRSLEAVLSPAISAISAKALSMAACWDARLVSRTFFFHVRPCALRNQRL
jgi:hypothetical protein